jgi:hypothetical protein
MLHYPAVRPKKRHGFFLSIKPLHPVINPKQNLILWRTEVLTLGIEHKGNEANHLAPFDVEVQITSTCISTYSYAFSTCTWATSSSHLLVCKLQSCPGRI